VGTPTPAATRPRSADPWGDTDVIDERGARFAQATTGVVALLGALLGWPLAWGLMSAQLFIGLVLGRRWCIPCVAYFTLLQPRFGEGPLEDSRPPRLANIMGSVCLGSAALLWWLGWPVAGTAIASLVALLALVSASTGFCAGCEIYTLAAKLRGISPTRHDRVDPSDLPALKGVPRSFVEFTHPLCAECQDWEQRLIATGDPLLKVDVRDKPDLAKKYGIAIVPTVVAVAPDGEVLERLAP
jgi:hypothetical protein